MGPGERAGGGGDAGKGNAAGGGGGGRSATTAGSWAVSALCLLLSVGSAAACLLLGVQAAALQGRVAALEEERELLRRAGPPGALDAWAEPHLERLLREVSVGARGWGGLGVPCQAGGRGKGEGETRDFGVTDLGSVSTGCALGHATLSPPAARVGDKAEARGKYLVTVTSSTYCS
ncbi:collagen alpha-1(XXIII) chain-like [Hylobates moloch]|uniref:collagen alpha-1(XXIII) chain-like n=1 Tax=Hylobates moloch TaxID=81572 RepID=UPI002674FBCC|nr:collagen alpha-1(XXIII) chain-like [Hylobates moloch]